MSNTLTAVIQADTSGFLSGMKAVSDSMKQFSKVNGQAAKEAKINNDVTTQQVASFNRVLKSIEKATDGTKTHNKEISSLNRSVKSLKDQYSNLSDTARNSDFGKAMASSIKLAEDRLTSLNTKLSQVKNNLRSMKGGFSFKGDNLLGSLNGSKIMSSMGSAATSALGIGSLAGPAAIAATSVTALAAAVKKGIEVNMEFEKSQSILQSVTGKSASELKSLTDQAMELGASTKYTASEIAGLQIELAKLGFNTTEIGQMTAHIQNFATSVGTDLSSAASMAGSVLRTFGLEAKDTQRIADVLSKSTSLCALDFEKLQTGLKNVAGVANTFGFTLEQTVAYLGALADKGIDASTAGTNLRNIILKLGESGGKAEKLLGYTVTSVEGFGKALNDLKKFDKGVLSSVFGSENVNSLMQLLNGSADSADKLATKLYDCAGAAQKMSDIMSDNLEGDLTKLASAWDGLLMSFGNGNDVIRELVQGLTKLVSKCTDAVKSVQAWYRDLYDNSIAVRAIVEGVVTAVKVQFDALVTTIKIAINQIAGAFKTIGKILEGDFKGAINEWENTLKKNGTYAKKHSEYVEDQFKKALRNIKKEVRETDGTTATINVDVKSNGKPVTTTNNGNSGINASTSKKEGFIEGSIGWYEDQIREAEKKIKNTTDKNLIIELRNQIKEWKIVIDELNSIPQPPEGSIAHFERLIKEEEKKIGELTDPEEIAKIRSNINLWKKEISKLKSEYTEHSLAFYYIQLEKDKKDIENIQDKLSEINTEYLSRIGVPLSELLSSPSNKASDVYKNRGNEFIEKNRKYLQDVRFKYGDVGKEFKGIIGYSDPDIYLKSIKFQREDLWKEELNNFLNTYRSESKVLGEKLKEAFEKENITNKLIETIEKAIGFKKGTIGWYENLIKHAEEDIRKTDDSSLIKALHDKIDEYNKEIEKLDPTRKKSTGTVKTNGEYFKDTIDGLQTINSSLGSIYDTMKSFGEIENPFDFIDNTLSIIQNIYSIIDTINKLSETLKKFSAITTSTAAAEAAAAATSATAASTEAAAQTTDAAAKTFNAHAAIPFVGAAIAGAMVGMMIASIAQARNSVPKYANGGIIDGTSTIGDYNIARVNSGEMILNGSQQKRLFNLLNSSSSGVNNPVSSNVSFRIKGQDLVGVLDTYNKRINKVR